jgi:hypothetical protein
MNTTKILFVSIAIIGIVIISFIMYKYSFNLASGNYMLVYAQSDYTTTYLSKDDIGLPNDPTNSKEIPVTYERLKYIEKNMMCSTTLSNFRMESNATLEAECRYIFENGVKVEQEHEAEQERLAQIERERASKLYQEQKAREQEQEARELAKEQNFYTETGLLEKIESVLYQCKIMSVNASIAELRACIDFIPEYYEVFGK